MKSVGGIHRTRLAASKVHRHLVKEARRTVQRLGWQVPEDDISPTVVGAIHSRFLCRTRSRRRSVIGEIYGS